jgi:hypothetical protein
MKNVRSGLLAPAAPALWAGGMDEVAPRETSSEAGALSGAPAPCRLRGSVVRDARPETGAGGVSGRRLETAASERGPRVKEAAVSDRSLASCDAGRLNFVHRGENPVKVDGRAGRRRWTAEDDAVLRARYAAEPTLLIAQALGRTLLATFNRAQTLGLAKSPEYLSAFWAASGQRAVTAGAATRFARGHVPANKGCAHRPGWAPGRMRAGQFRRGERRGVAVRLYQPIGTERISKDGYLQRKTNDDLPLQRRWRFVHVLVWEAANGPVPEGHAIVFRNGDRRDIRLDNLELVTRAELMRRNTVHNLPAPLAKTVQLLGTLNRQIRRKAREKENAA